MPGQSLIEELLVQLQIQWAIVLHVSKAGVAGASFAQAK